ncbi:response regulator [Acinetobacter baumannii]|uniref:response regulator n=1 Tax=Acinetobacter baumannii TaxID=470 RepID=UPI00062C10EA|nr:response regulator [Acinetobacter baumannii]EHU1298006.1 response regulator [Acinetobacter baumannii]KKZ30760.1 hypothetical protein UN97_11415 [Acinetobacter baumannii]KKZ46836.1 hypothetical protein UN99_11390 [Acinetobacter baumannii]MDO7383292.1 response regulator [Acinetobacter baumannii]TPS29119.1 response regulator [Acinetobacter baumannii]
MSFKLAYIDEQETSISNFYSHFADDYELLTIKVDKNSTIESILEECFKANVDAIITDYKLEEEGNVNFNGDALFNAIKKIKPHFPVIMLTSWEPEAIDHMENVHLIYNKDILDGKSKEEFDLFNSKICHNIKNYYKKIDDTNERISILVDKRIKTDLTVSEEEELTKLYMLYDELHPEGKEIPSNLIQKESITQLNDFLNEAKEILVILKKINEK